jgi:hypothetical protein
MPAEPVPTIPVKIGTHLQVNAYLIFSQQSSEMVVDEYTGNVEQVAIGGEPIRIPCSLKDVWGRGRLPREEKTSGLALNQTVVRGYILASPNFMNTFDISAQMPIEIQSPVEGSVVNGLIDITGTINPHSLRINQVSGIPFTGLLTRIGSGETAEYAA